MKNVTVRNRTQTHRGVLGCCTCSYQTKKRMRYQATTKSQHGHCAYQCIFTREEKVGKLRTKNAKPKTAKRKYKLAEEERQATYFNTYVPFSLPQRCTAWRPNCTFEMCGNAPEMIHKTAAHLRHYICRKLLLGFSQRSSVLWPLHCLQFI